MVSGSAMVSGASGGGCCTIRCALVPLTPKAETAAVRRCSVLGQGVASVSNCTVPVDQSMCGLG